MKTKTKMYICILLVAGASYPKVSKELGAYLEGHNPLAIVMNKAAEVSK